MATSAPGPSRVSSDLGDLRNVKLCSFYSTKGGQGHYVRGKHLSIADVDDVLTKNSRYLNKSGQIMMKTLKNLRPHSFEPIKHRFMVSKLQHVTDKSSVEGIYSQGCFRITKSNSRRDFSDLIYWSADITSKDITEARKTLCAKAKQVIPAKYMSKEYERKIRFQFANSPAFKRSASPYGNFKFSFQLSELLDLYKVQHCGGETPQLRILGTDLYKQEITHNILVHGPHKSNGFGHLPLLPSDKYSSGPVYIYKDNTVYWTPDSTSNNLKIRIVDGYGPKKSVKLCEYKMPLGSVWNFLVFGFHLPEGRGLKIQKGKLLEHLTVCKRGNISLLPENKWLDEKKAKIIISEMKKKHMEQSSQNIRRYFLRKPNKSTRRSRM